MLTISTASLALRCQAPMMQLTSTRGGTKTSYTGGVVPTRTPVATDSAILVQGGSLRTWSYRSPSVEQVQVVLSTEGRPLDADIELWHGPDNTPCKMRVYVENGQLRPFSAVIETPRGPNTVAIRNIGQIEFPIAANVIADQVDSPSPDCLAASTTIQGGALRTYPFDPTVDSVQVLLKTDGRPLNARIELLQGPNNNKQVIELYTEDGLDRPFFLRPRDAGLGQRRAHRQHRADRVPDDRCGGAALHQRGDELRGRARRRRRHRGRRGLLSRVRAGHRRDAYVWGSQEHGER